MLSFLKRLESNKNNDKLYFFINPFFKFLYILAPAKFDSCGEGGGGVNCQTTLYRLQEATQPF